MTDQSTEGLRKAARRVFWEASNIDAQIDQACREEALGIARGADLLTKKEPERINNTARVKGKDLDWAEAYNVGWNDALKLLAFIVRNAPDEDFKDKLDEYCVENNLPAKAKRQ